MGAKIKTKVYLLIVCLPMLVAGLFVTLVNTTAPVFAAAGINSQLSFEGKIVKSDGTNITDGTYNMEFKIYQDGTNTGSGSTLMWTEDYLVAGSTGMPSTGGVTLSSGTFQVNLGSVCSFVGGTCGAKTNTGVDWNQQTLWLSMQIGNASVCTVTSGATSFATAGAGNCNGDGEMSPFIRLTAVPQAQVALSANTLGGTLTAANFVQLAQGLQADSSTTNASIAINKTGATANILTLQKSSTPVMVLDNNGLLTLQPAAALTGTSIQSHISQTLTNNQTGGTVNGFNQAITVSNASGTTISNGLNLSITDATALANTNNLINSVLTDNGSGAKVNAGLNVSLTGSNTSQSQYGVTTGVNAGIGIRGGSSGVSGGNVVCGPTSAALSIGVCGYSSLAAGTAYGGYFSASGNGGTALYATNGASTSSILRLQDNTTDVLTVADNGGVTLQNSTDSATAFQIKEQSGSTVFNVDNTKANVTNLVANSSFESAISNWAAVGTGTASQSSAQLYEGTKSLLIASGTTEGGASYSTGATTFLATNTTYTLSAYIKTDSSTPVHIDMGDEEATGTLIPCLTNQLLSQNGGWTRFTCTWTTSAVSPTNSFIYIKQTSTDPAASKNIYVDDVLLQLDANADTNYRNAAINLTGSIINGPVILQNASNSTNALQVQNSSGSTILNVDTTDANLISNPGFEVNQTGWTAAASTVVRRDAIRSYLGNYSLQSVIAGATTGGTQFSLNPVVTTTTALGGNYTVSFFALLGSGTAPTYQITYSPDGTATSTCSPAGTIVTTGWMRLSCSGLTSATVPTTSGFIKIAQTNTAISTWYIDGVQLENTAAATAYGAGAVSLNGVITSPVVFKGNSNATTAFQIQNSISLNMLGVDTVNNNIQVGSNTTDASAVFLTLDSYSTAADPTAPANGAMYYNTSTNVFRCRENSIWKNCIDPPSNASVGDQSPTAATLTYLTGSAVAIPQGGVRAGSQFIWRMSLSKTAAGTAAPTFAVVFGTTGTTTDVARASFTLPAETAAVDTAQITIICTVRVVSATGTISCNLQLVHNAANAVGFVGTATSGSVAITTTSATFDNTVANSIMGVTVNSGAANAFTFQQVQAQAVNL